MCNTSECGQHHVPCVTPGTCATSGAVCKNRICMQHQGMCATLVKHQGTCTAPGNDPHGLWCSVCNTMQNTREPETVCNTKKHVQHQGMCTTPGNVYNSRNRVQHQGSCVTLGIVCNTRECVQH